MSYMRIQLGLGGVQGVLYALPELFEVCEKDLLRQRREK